MREDKTLQYKVKDLSTSRLFCINLSLMTNTATLNTANKYTNNCGAREGGGVGVGVGRVGRGKDTHTDMHVLK